MNFLRQLFTSNHIQHEPDASAQSRAVPRSPDGPASGMVLHRGGSCIGEGMPDQQPRTPREAVPSLRPSTHDLQIGLASDPGRVRDRNEDASLAWQFTLAQHGQPPLPIGLFIIADGMGGHARGEQASALATRLSASHIIRYITLPFLSDDEDMAERAPIHEILAASVRIAHEAVIHRFPEAGTTLTLALMLGENVYIAHLGDSRAYLGERGSLRPLTQDHSMAARLLEMGQATPEEVASHRNILYKAIGQGVDIEPDFVCHDLCSGQYLLLCCDGLWGKVPDEQISTIIEAAATPDIACQNLVAQANKNGGEDNISVILIAKGWPLPPAARSPAHSRQSCIRDDPASGTLPAAEPTGQDRSGARELRSDDGI